MAKRISTTAARRDSHNSAERVIAVFIGANGTRNGIGELERLLAISELTIAVPPPAVDCTDE
jgi:hypothetical protein